MLCGVFSERPPVYAKSASPAHNSQGVTQHNEADYSASTSPKPTLQREGGYMYTNSIKLLRNISCHQARLSLG